MGHNDKGPVTGQIKQRGPVTGHNKQMGALDGHSKSKGPEGGYKRGPVACMILQITQSAGVHTNGQSLERLLDSKFHFAKSRLQNS